MTKQRLKMQFKPQDMKALEIGIGLCATIGGLVFLGYYLDGQFETSPWLTLAGTFLGMFGGVWNAYRAATGKRMMRFDKRTESTSDKNPPSDSSPS